MSAIKLAEFIEQEMGDFLYMTETANELRRLDTIEQAAIALIKCKGRYHAEQNTKALAEALGIELQYINLHPDSVYLRTLKNGGVSLLTNC